MTNPPKVPRPDTYVRDRLSLHERALRELRIAVAARKPPTGGGGGNTSYLQVAQPPGTAGDVWFKALETGSDESYLFWKVKNLSRYTATGSRWANIRLMADTALVDMSGTQQILAPSVAHDGNQVPDPQMRQRLLRNLVHNTSGWHWNEAYSATRGGFGLQMEMAGSTPDPIGTTYTTDELVIAPDANIVPGEPYAVDLRFIRETDSSRTYGSGTVRFKMRIVAKNSAGAIVSTSPTWTSVTTTLPDNMYSPTPNPEIQVTGEIAGVPSQVPIGGRYEIRLQAIRVNHEQAVRWSTGPPGIFFTLLDVRRKTLPGAGGAYTDSAVTYNSGFSDYNASAYKPGFVRRDNLTGMCTLQAFVKRAADDTSTSLRAINIGSVPAGFIPAVGVGAFTSGGSPQAAGVEGPMRGGIGTDGVFYVVTSSQWMSASGRYVAVSLTYPL